MNKKVFLFAVFPLLILVSFAAGFGINTWNISHKENISKKKELSLQDEIVALRSEVVPDKGFELPVTWGNLGPKLVDLGVIDINKFESAVPMSNEEEKILTQGSAQKLTIDSANSQFVVDFLWAVGLAQKSVVYTEGPMGKEYKSDQAGFASTGGWSLGNKDSLAYLNRYELIPLTPEQNTRVGNISKNVYRPCCGNSTWFPDCNHGMAALGAIEMMVAENLSDEEIYTNILKLNSFWFPDSYILTALYFKNQGIDWKDVDAKEALGSEYSSAQGAANIAKKVGPLPKSGGGGSCGA